MSTGTRASFGQLLRRYRRAAGLTQEELAERAQLSAFTISALERGANQSPRKDTLALLADALALSSSERAALEGAARGSGAIPDASPSTTRPTSPFVGRAAELAMLGRHLAGEGPPVLLLAGEPGIGKSRLLAEAAVLAEAVGWTVLAGGCTRRDGQEPYAPLLQALERAIADLEDGARGTALAGCAWLVRLLPELAGEGLVAPATGLPSEQERRLMFRAVERFLGNMAGPAGTLLLLDDLQWAGMDALNLLATLVRSAHEFPLRVVGAYRSTEVGPDHHLSLLFGELAESALIRQVTLGALPPVEAGDLFDRLLGAAAAKNPALRARVLERTDGVPFFLVSYARELEQQACGDMPEDLPWNLRQSVRRRLAALPDPARELVGTAAIIGRTATYKLLSAVLSQPETVALSALEAACAGGLLERMPDAAYCFTHDVIREVAEAEMGVERRQVGHLRIAAVLADQPGLPPVEILANHYLQGGDLERAVTYMEQAGDKAAAAHANHDALDYYAQALVVNEKLGNLASPVVLAVIQKLGHLHRTIQHVRDAILDYDRMVAVARRLGDRRQEGMALACRGWAEEDDHEFETAEATLRAALTVADEGYDDVREIATCRLVHLLLMVGRKAEAQTLLDEALVLARQRGDQRLLQAFTGLLTLFHTWDGRFDRAMIAVERSRSLDEQSPADEPGARWFLALIRGGMGDYDGALTLLHECLALGERTGEVWAYRRTLNTLGWLYGELQDHQRALEWNTRGVEAARERLAPETNPECENNARLNLADTLMALGRLDEAEAQLRLVEATVRNPQPQDRYMLWRYAQHLFHSYGELRLVQGDVGTALAYAGECLALAEPTSSRKNIVKGRRLRGQALLAEGRLAEADWELDIALRSAREVGNPAQLWRTLVALGDLRLAQGRVQVARAEYQTALAVIDQVATVLADAPLRETFLNSAYVQHIRGRAF